MDKVGPVFVPETGGCRALPTVCWFIGVALAVSACAAGPKDAARAIPSLDPAKGRVFVYRSSTSGTAYVPDVLLNGERVGMFDRPGLIFRDVAPGSYAVATTKSSRIVNFAVRAGETKYVKLTGGYFESHMHPELVDAAQGGRETSGLGLLTPTPAKKK
jgi:hypothetical protein